MNGNRENLLDIELQKTLDNLLNDWQSGKQIVEWAVIPPVNLREQEQKIKMMKYAIYGTDALIVLFGLLSYFFNETLGFDKTAGLIFFCLTLLIAAVSVFVGTPVLLKNMRRSLHNQISVSIDRSNKLATITSAQPSQKLQYGSGVLPSFILPRNAMQHYEEKRRTLQQQISAETGFSFEELHI
ncbi:MAG: hypothetical protein IJ566_06110 [Cardiobacteriaceae bacterium]|nr:hypothetical protein [Cardiobacteriaceae bacterium]